MTLTILKTKFFIPPLQKEHVKRQRITDRLKNYETGKLVVISAAAGFGKTSLLSEWGNSNDASVAWFSLDKTDNDPNRFLYCLISALQTLDIGIGEPFPWHIQTPSIELPLTALVNSLTEQKRPLSLVLDNYQVIMEQQIHDGVFFLINNAPPWFQIVISSRTNIPLQLSSLRSRQRLTEIKTDELRFTFQESINLFNKTMKLGVSKRNIEILIQRTEGWPAGLQIASIALKSPVDHTGFILSFSGNYNHVTDYFVEEVLSKQSQQIQIFLYEIAILNRFTGSLCESVTHVAESSEILEMLSKQNLFIFPLDSEQKWFRFHTLFIELLRKKLKKHFPDKIQELHCRASEWFENKGLIDESIHHAEKADDFDRLLNLAERYCIMYLGRNQKSTVLRWFQTIPQNLARQRPMILVAEAWAIHLEKTEESLIKIEGLIQEVEKALTEEQNELFSANYHEQEIRSHIAGLRAIVARESGDSHKQVIQLSKQALKYGSENDDILKSIVLYNLGLAYVSAGDFDKGSRILKETERIGRITGNFFASIVSVFLQAWIMCEKGELSKADTICRNILKSLLDQTGNHICLPVIGVIYICQGSIWLERNNLDKASKALEIGIELTRSIEAWGILLIGYKSLARLRRTHCKKSMKLSLLTKKITALEPYRKGANTISASLEIEELLSQIKSNPVNLAKAETLAKEKGLDFNEFINSDNHFYSDNCRRAGQFSLVRIFIAQIRTGSKYHMDKNVVFGFLNSQLELDAGKGLLKRMIKTNLLLALVYDAIADDELALEFFSRAITQAEPQEFRRVFIEEGGQIINLLGRLIIQGIHHKFAGELLAAINQERRSESKIKSLTESTEYVESLSRREMEVLRLIEAGLSNREIAYQFNISEETIKKHNYNIFSKLNVNKRIQAIAKARKMGLLANPQ